MLSLLCQVTTVWQLTAIAATANRMTITLAAGACLSGVTRYGLDATVARSAVMATVVQAEANCAAPANKVNVLHAASTVSYGVTRRPQPTCHT